MKRGENKIMSLSDCTNKVLKKIESELLKNNLTEKLGFKVSHDEDVPYTPKPFWEELRSSVGLIKSAGKKIVYLLLIYSFGAVRLGFGGALMKILLFVSYSAIPIFVIWKFGLTGYIGYFLIPMTVWMLGGFWAFFDLPLNTVLRENNQKITDEIEEFINELELAEKEELDLLENQLEKVKAVPNQTISTFRIILLSFYLSFSYFISETWKNEKPDAPFILFGFLVTVLSYFFIESYASLRNSTFLVAFSAINNLKCEKIKEKTRKEISANKEIKFLYETKTQFIPPMKDEEFSRSKRRNYKAKK